MRKHTLYYILLSMTALLFSCDKDIHRQEVDKPVSETVSLEIFTRLQSYHIPVAGRSVDENKVEKTPWVLVFRGNDANALFVEAVQAVDISATNKRYITLSRQTDGNPYQLLILANPQEKFVANGVAYTYSPENFEKVLSDGSRKTLSEACSLLLTQTLDNPQTSVPFTNGDSAGTLPMSYLLGGITNIDENTRIGNDNAPLHLIRTVAKVVLRNPLSTDTFSLQGITAVVNAPSHGELYNYESIPATMDVADLIEYKVNQQYDTELVTAEQTGAVQSTENSPVYLYESGAANDTYLIVKATYSGRDCYYKLLFIDAADNQIDLLRNHQYTINITSVKGPGYYTVADAKASKPSNTALDFKITITDISSYEIMANNEYYLGVSNSTFIAYTDEYGGNGKEFVAFELATNCTRLFTDYGVIYNPDWPVYIKEPTPDIYTERPQTAPILMSPNSIPVNTVVKVSVDHWLHWDDNYFVALRLGNIEKNINIRRRPAIPSAKTTLLYGANAVQKAESYDFSFYCLSAYIDEGSEEDKNAKEWIKLRPSYFAEGDEDRVDTDRIIVDDGIIRIEVQENTTGTKRSGIVYLTTIAPVIWGEQGTMRLKINITQNG